jgi:glycosyltransferase involved in cell wall biosynthesis
VSADDFTSIVVPTYNRAGWLPQCIASIAAQTDPAWELIVVDDGSTDDTPRVIERLFADLRQSARYLRQANAGPEAARNAGIRAARGDRVAFLDSDDAWLPHHLETCAAVLRDAPEVDWVFSAAQKVDPEGRILERSALESGGQRCPFLDLHTRPGPRGVKIIDDPALLECTMAGGLWSGLQTSLVRRALLERFPCDERYPVVDDQVHPMRMLVGASARFAYFEDVHVLYRVHDSNASAVGGGRGVARGRRLHGLAGADLEDFYARFGRDLPLRARRVLRRRIADHFFWTLGYTLYLQPGDFDGALAHFRRGIGWWPYRPAYWKSLVIGLGRQMAARLRGGAPGSAA